ncbi:MAG: glutamine-hydrolyzing GMP synthase [Oscillospiraceae bacterium]|nr:glutamine-hydrolyzing GMP synthase [Oscillospiraceae bacterium]MDD3833404.1 glutamine-hydrolyzing GMP synthase [Oscillospiraceae bacterium]
MQNETVLVLDFGGQHNQLIARRVREAGVYSVVLPNNTPLEEIRSAGYKGIILTGDPQKINDDESWQYVRGISELGVPVLSICYGAQLLARSGGGRVESEGQEYLPTLASIENGSRLFKGLDEIQQCRMSHDEYISIIPDGFKAVATTPNCSCAAMEDEARLLYAVQFHPEVMHTENGVKMLNNFLFEICGCRGDWEMSSFVQASVENICGQIGGKRVLCALSGGVDSSVAAVMVAKAVGSQLTCIFVDHGLLRKDEGDMVEKMFAENFDINFIRVNAQKRFLDRLAGVTDPERKRKIIGEEFIRVFEEEANKLGEIDYLVQGTIYPDIIESGGDKSAVIKSHHNVGGLPERMNLKLCEPLRDLFKDEVRRAGLELGLPEDMVWRQPFPGPGLAVRCIGAITVERLDILRYADAIFREEIENAGLGRDINQFFAIITDMRSVGVTENVRTYDYTIALRAVKTTDFMTAEWARVPLDVLAKASNRIVSEVKGVNRIVYDITSKPPATIEWE